MLIAIIVSISSGLAPRANAQGTGASLSGLVTDSSGAPVPAAGVTAQNLATNVTLSTQTDGAGLYRFASLAVGDYQVSVERAGFAKNTQRVHVDTASRGRLDLSLSVAGSVQSVNVVAASADLSPDDSSVGTTIGSREVAFTPLYLRQWDDLIRLVPGVQANRYTDQSGATSAGRTGGFNVHGVHSLQNNFVLDGIDNNSISENVQELTTEVARPSVDTIQEFRVITNPYAAEFGRAPGATVAVTTKGGSNEFHGLAFEYLRNRVFDANDFFSNKSGLAKPQNEQNQFGGNFGGPIVKDKLFAFFDYEGTRIRRGVSRIATVPLANERIGDFSPATGAALGIKYPVIYDPTTGQPFANNQIPANRIDPYMTKIMNLFPLPNLPGELNNFARNGGLSDDNDNFDWRADWNPTERDQVFARYSYSNRSRFIPGNFGGIADGTSTSAWGRQKLQAYSGVIGWTRSLTPTLTNEFRAGYLRNYSFAEQDPFGKNLTDEYVPGVPENPAVNGGISQTQFANYTSIGSPDFLPKSQVTQQLQWIDSVSLTRGAHSLKFGADVRGPMRNIFQDEPGTRGSLGFDRIFTCQRGANGQCVGNTGLSYADGLLGYVKSAQLSNVLFVDQRIRMFSGYAQDDWKVTQHLTLNLGLRYDFAPAAMEGRNRIANFNPAGSGSLTYASDGSLSNRSLVNTNTNNWGPRVGFAYSPTAKTVIRGGYGIFYTLFERYGSENQLALNPPYLINNTPAVASTATAPVFLLRNGFPANFLDPAALNYKLVHLRAVNSNLPTPSVQQWSFGVQREISAGLTAEVNYVGTKSTHLDVLSDLNQPVNGVQPYPNFGYIEYTNAIGNGTYQGLETSVHQRFRNGLELRVAWTWSKSIDNAPDELSSNSGSAQNGLNYAAWRGPSDFDIPQHVVASYVYELPVGRGHKLFSNGWGSWVLGNWTLSGVYTFSSGRPFTVNSGGSLGSAIDPYGAATAVPNVIGTPHIVGTVGCWYYASQNPSCASAGGLTDAFQLQAPGQFGNAGRNILRGPRTDVFDLSILKDFRISEKQSVQFRWEIFNLTNTKILSLPNNNFSSAAAGSITGLAGDPRVMQFALRYAF
ncbi:MAG TPA: TonB-dependent receptor [Bryobacteraceae bacterium]|nr:TonB-dependent receptor [Bryobacteraceae bacterium]